MYAYDLAILVRPFLCSINCVIDGTGFYRAAFTQISAAFQTHYASSNRKGHSLRDSECPVSPSGCPVFI